MHAAHHTPSTPSRDPRIGVQATEKALAGHQFGEILVAARPGASN